MDCEKKLQEEQLDRMWLALIIEAKQCGITLEQVRKFIEKDSAGKETQQIR